MTSTLKLIKSEVGEQENKSLVRSSANNLLIYLLKKTRVNATYLKSDSLVEIVSIFYYFRHSFEKKIWQLQHTKIHLT